MIKQHHESNKKLVENDVIIEDNPNLFKGAWVEVTSPTPQEIEWLKQS